VNRREFIVRSTGATALAALRPRLGIGAPGASLAPAVNLLRNGTFQDDWITSLPANKTLHWAYPYDLYNRRDYNPDGWSCKGSWQWVDADRPMGARRMLLAGPDAQVVQRVNWIAVHDDRALDGFADAGQFPTTKARRSRRADRLVRDVTVRVRVKGRDVPAGAGSVELGFCPPGPLATSDPMGEPTPPLARVSAPIPTGTFEWQSVEITLRAAAWLERAAAPPDPMGPLLPGTVRVAIQYKGAAGQIEIGGVELIEPGPSSPNLLPNGGFEATDASGYPAGWERPQKYRYFPPGLYYLFNTWHNARFDNRGPVSGDRLVTHGGGASLRMTLASGDETSVASAEIALNQAEPRFIEVAAWVKTDRLCALQIDAVDEGGRRLDGFDFIHKAPLSVGTNEWRLVRQVFHPRQPVKSLRLQLCARGANGYTLGNTAPQPQNNVVGTVWWDDVKLYEPESTEAELVARGVKPASEIARTVSPYLAGLDLGERRLGANELRAAVVNPGTGRTFALRWELASPSGTSARFESAPQRVETGGRAAISVPYRLAEPCARAYTEYRGKLTLLADGRALRSEEVWLATWTGPLAMELGALYLSPGERQLVRMNLGLPSPTLASVKTVRLQLRHRRTGQIASTTDVAATPEAIRAQRERIPEALRGDFDNLLLVDLDVAGIPLQPFADPERKWLVRAIVLDAAGQELATADSASFCRQDHEPLQAAVTSVRVDAGNLLYVNDRPWMPWGATYGHVPQYSGPLAPTEKHRNLHQLPGWSQYDGFRGLYERRTLDFNCSRYVGASITPRAALEKAWAEDNRYASTVFAVPAPVFSLAELVAKAGGRETLDAYLAFAKTAPMVVSTAPGIEEAFGLFEGATAVQLAGLRQAVEHLRRATGKPVMVGHGGYWNRFEFEKVPYFDIYDPETEPFYPANLHTDLRPLVEGKAQAIWLRPQMYEDVPYERWRFHAFTELMRGCRGWQIAHGPADASLFRGLHGELERMKPYAYSQDPGPRVQIEPKLEHWSRAHGGKTAIVAATTRGIALGHWRGSDEAAGMAGRARITDAAYSPMDEGNSYGIGEALAGGSRVHGIQYLPDARAWPAGSRLVQWVRIAGAGAPPGVAIVAKADGRWIHVATWGVVDVAGWRHDLPFALWFVRAFYRHAAGFLGWDLKKTIERAGEYVPERGVDVGARPAVDQWVKLEVPLERIGAAEKLLDGVAFLHTGGRVAWGRTSILDPRGVETLVWGDSIEIPPDTLARTRIHVNGLVAGTRVRVLFEDREIVAADGHFEDDFRGEDLYQRFGGGYGVGYGDGPVALHVYELPTPAP
jgi:hypothetical protein